MADVKWIKIVTDIFDNQKIKLIEKMPDGDSIIVIWVKILCLAGSVNDQGYIYLTKEIPYTDEMLATAFNRPLPVVRLALEVFRQFEMIELIDSVYHVSSWEKYQNIDGMERIREQTRARVAKHREIKRLEQCNVTSNATVTQCNATEKEEERDIDKERELKEKKVAKATSKEKIEKPQSVDQELDQALNDFAMMRKAIKAPLTERAKQLILAKLEKLAPDTEGKIAILNQSIENGWKSIYPVRDETQQRSGYMTKGEQARKDLQDGYERIAQWAERKEKEENDEQGIWGFG